MNRLARTVIGFGLVTIGLLASGVSLAHPLRDGLAVLDSLSGIHPRNRAGWLRARGLDDSYYTTFRKPESTGLVCVGRWPWGPSWELTGRDSLLFLGSGSGVRVLSITDSVHPRMLGQIDARGLVSQVVIRDSLLFVACGNWGAQIYSVSNPANPRELGSMDAVIGDIAVKDTICYALGGDSLRIYNVANPSLPARLSALRDSGEVLAVANNHAFTGNQFVMNVIDVSDPAQPRWVNSRSGDYLSLSSRCNLLFQGSYDPEYFAILNVSNPLAVTEVSRLTGLSANGMHVQGDYAYLAWGGLRIVSIADSAHPVLRGTSTHYDDEREPYVFAPGTYAYLACRYGGLKVIDIHQETAPRETATCYVAGSAQDIAVQDTVALVSSYLAGVNTVGLGLVAAPHDLGWLGPLSGTQQVTYGCALRDSFGFVGWQPNPYFRTLSLTDPANPAHVGGCTAFEFAQDMVLKDSFAYCAENYKFQVVNVARPRSPTVVGTCNMGSNNWGVDLQDNLAYVGSWAGLIILNVARPDSPYVLSTTGGTRTSTWGVAARDTFVFVPSGYETLWVFSAADPRAPYAIAGAPLGQGNWGYDATMVDDTLVFVGCKRDVKLVNVRDPARPRVVGSHPTPTWVRRVEYAAPYLYAACSDAGVLIFETTSVGIKEPPGFHEKTRSRLEVLPTLVQREVLIRLPGNYRQQVVLQVVDIGGRTVRQATVQAGSAECRLDTESLSSGLYFVVAREGARSQRTRFVKP